MNYAGECKGSCAMKRGEQKPVLEMKTPEESLGIDSETYNKIIDECIYGEQKHAEWSEEDEKIYQSIMDDTVQENQLNGKQTDWLRDIKYRYFPQPKQEWSREDSVRMDELCTFIQDYGDNFYCSSLKMIVINWLKSLKDRVQPKQEWNEEDMKMIGTLVAIFEVNYPDSFYKVNPIGTTNMQGIHSSEIIKWLKSLRPQNRWKPSDEQLDALYDILNPCDGVDKKALESLYEQLKAL